MSEYRCIATSPKEELPRRQQVTFHTDHKTLMCHMQKMDLNMTRVFRLGKEMQFTTQDRVIERIPAHGLGIDHE